MARNTLPRYVTVTRLGREFRLPWARAEAIVREQTARARMGWLWRGLYLGAFAVGMGGVPWLAADRGHGFELALRLWFLALMVAGLLLPRVLARDAILEAARRARDERDDPARPGL